MYVLVRSSLIMCMYLQNEELISSSELGDVMKVVSLLNSGADVQTKDKVDISHLSSFAHLYHHVTLVQWNLQIKDKLVH